MSLDIRTRRVYEARSTGEGLRVLVDRVWPRGMSKEAVAADIWLKEAAPSTELRRWFGHEPAKWHEFRKRYFRELDSNPDPVAELLKAVSSRRVTLLYSARDTKLNQAVALKEYLLNRLAADRLKDV